MKIQSKHPAELLIDASEENKQQILSDEYLEKQSVETLARWSSTLNNWRWPSDMIGKPIGFDNLKWYLHCDDKRKGREKTRHDFISPVMKKIEEIIGDKECLRWHHLNNLKRTNEEFEKWWAES